MLRHKCQSCGERTVDLLANRKCTNVFVITQNVTKAIWRLTLRRVLMETLELKFLCENIAFVLNNINNTILNSI